MKKLLLTFGILLLPYRISSQLILAPLPWKITSDYGPRMLTYWDFHHGIDYAGGYGEPIIPVESGMITRIKYLNGGYDIFGGIIPNPNFKPQEEGLKLKDTTVGKLA